jgi:hypothetical protein
MINHYKLYELLYIIIKYLSKARFYLITKSLELVHKSLFSTSASSGIFISDICHLEFTAVSRAAEDRVDKTSVSLAPIQAH